MNRNFTCTLSKIFLMLVFFSMVSSSILPYYFLGKTDSEFVCDSKEEKEGKKEENKEEKKEKKEKIRDNINGTEYLFSQKELRYYNFENFHYTHFQEIETPPPESLS